MLSNSTTRRRLWVAASVVAAALALGAAAAPASAQEAACMELIGKQVRGLMKTGLKGQDKCHKTANKICVGSDGVCNDPDDNAYQILDKGKYGKTKAAAIGKVTAADSVCATAPSTIALYPGGLVNSMEFFDDQLAGRADYLLGSENLVCDEAKVKCFSTISKNRNNLTDKMLKGALDCYAAATPGTPITATTCLASTEAALAGAIAGAREKINAACTDVGISGSDVGSCNPLPQNDPNNPALLYAAADCVTDGAIAEGKLAAIRAFPPASCSPVTGVMARTASVDIVTPTDLAGLEIEVTYPNAGMSLPSNGTPPDIDIGRFSNFSVSTLLPNDLDGKLRIIAADFLSPISSGQLVDVAFDTCAPLTIGSCADEPARACENDNDCKVCENFCSGGTANGEACVVNGDCPGGTCPATGNVGTNCTTQAQCTGGTVCGAGVVSDAPCNITNGLCSFSEFTACAPANCPEGESCVSHAALASCAVTNASDQFGNPVDGVTCSVTLSEP